MASTTYSTWEYYQNTYKGKLTQTQYESHAPKAKAEIDSQTYDRAQSAPESMAGRLSVCECALVDALQEFVARYALLPKGLQSINNDSLSVSAGAINDFTAKQDGEQGTYRRICLRYLTRPKNLMYRGL